MLEALWWGAFASSSLLIGAAFALRVTVNRLVLGLVMGFGAGVLLSAVAFELVEEAFDTSGVLSDVATGLFAGCAVYTLGDAVIDRRARSHPAAGRHGERRNARGGLPLQPARGG